MSAFSRKKRIAFRVLKGIGNNTLGQPWKPVDQAFLLHV
jgi:hypothetical protein